MFDRFAARFRATFSSLAIRNYRLYFYGQSVSLSGTWMQTVALAWLTLQITGSGSQLGLVIAGQFLPLLLFGPWAGIFVDKNDKRTILLVTQSLFILVSLILGVLVFFEVTEVWMLYAAALASGFIRLFDNPARHAFLPEIVDAARLRNAISLHATVNNVARAIGPSIGGILIATTSIAFCFLLNAATYIAVIAMLIAMRVEEMEKSVPVMENKGLIRQGWEYLQATPFIKNLLIMMAVIGTFAYAFQVSLALLSDQTFLTGASGYATLMSAFGVGAVLGGLFSAGKGETSVRQFLAYGLLFAFSMIAAALSPTFAFAVASIFATGFFSINLLSSGQTMVQLKSNPEMRGRIMALWSMALLGSTPIGGPIIGFIGEHAGARWSLAVGGIATILAVIYGFYTLTNRDRVDGL